MSGIVSAHALRRVGTFALILAVIASTVALPLAAPASAATATAMDAAMAFATPSVNIIGAAIESQPAPETVAVRTDAIAPYPMTGGEYLVLSSGRADDIVGLSQSPNANLNGDAVRGGIAYDVTVLRIDFAVPPDKRCLAFDFRMYSTEYPQYVNTQFNDTFVAELDSSTWTAATPNVEAPNNFAFVDVGGENKTITISNVPMSKENATGTSFSASGLGGASVPLRAQTPISPGPHALYLSVFDIADRVLDTTMLLDSLVLDSRPPELCGQGAVVAPPTISSIPDQTITVNSSAGPLAFTVGDNDTPLDALTVTASSSNSTLVPESGLALAGSGANRTLTVTPATGQTGTATITLGVTDQDGGSNSTSFLLTVNSDQANIAPLNVSVTGPGSVSSSPAGISCGNDCSQNFPTGTSVTLTATPNSGASFVGWGGACAGTDPCTLTMDQAASVSALFEVVQVSNVVATISAGVPLIEADGNGSFRIDLSDNAPQGGLSVAYTVGGTATNGSDYQSLSGSALIPANATSLVVPVLVNDDANSEGDETLVVTLAAGSGYQIGSANSATLDVLDDDLRVANLVAGDTPAEGGSDGSFVVNLAAPAPSVGLVVRYTVGGSAANGSDYTQLSGTLIIPAGASSGTIAVDVTDDTRSEGPETVTLTLNSNTGYIRGSSTSATLTIGDNDIRYATIAAQGSPAEASGDAAFVVTLAAPAPSAGLVVRYTVGGTAANGSDYATLSGNLNVPANATSASIPLDVINDTRSEGPETVTVTLGQNPGYVIGTPSSATLTIVDDDIRYANISLGTAAGEPSTAGNFVITFAAPAPSTGMVLRYTVGGTAVSGSDYVALSGSLNVPANATEVSLPVTALDDTLYEPNDTLVITLGQNPGYVIGSSSSATMTLVDNDVRTATISLRGNASEPGTNGSFAVELNGPAPSTGLLVRYTISGSAANGSDYQQLSGTLTILAGMTSGTIRVVTSDDALAEGTETVVITLGQSPGYVLGTPKTATLKIYDNEASPNQAQRSGR